MLTTIAFCEKKCRVCGEKLGQLITMEFEAYELVVKLKGDPFCWEDTCKKYKEAEFESDDELRKFLMQGLMSFELDEFREAIISAIEKVVAEWPEIE